MANPKQSDFPNGWRPTNMRLPVALARAYLRTVAQMRANPTQTKRFDFPGPIATGDVDSASLNLQPQLKRAAVVPRRQWTGNIIEVTDNGRANTDRKQGR